MFRGAGTAIITPFTEDLQVDFDALRAVVQDQLAGGIQALIVLGTTGEAPVISEHERKQIIDTVMEENGGQAKVLVGTGGTDTFKTLQLNAWAEKHGVDGLLIVNPYYNKSTQRGLITHYRAICELTSLPVMLYNVPSRTAMNMLPETILAIHEACPNVVAVKEACGDISQIAKLMAMKPDTLEVFSGNDDQALPMMALGAAGVISVFANVYPMVMAAIADNMLAGNANEALRIHNKYLRFMNLLFIETSPMPVKYACSIRGLCKNTLRLPLVPVTTETEDVLRSEMDKLKGMF
ncbi:MAG: 4-hydroxy-tetrahydrodipicolinate synthase [Ignavibacteriales bacterium]|nr:4-hydroxy-tetrahydrodipicolinate synthase [Ignavibacteriales bacterium]